MNDMTEQLLKSYKPRLAIVAYTSDTDDRWDDCYLESHMINQNGQLMEGKPLLQDTIQGMVDVFFDERQNTSHIGGFLPSNVLQYELLPGGFYNLMWWQPAQKKYIHFAAPLRIPSGTAWVPPLVYQVQRKQLSVYAIAADQRPDETTILYRSPFHNVGNHGTVCLGSASVKKPAELTFKNIIQYWEDLFWKSEFSHLNGSTNPTKSPLADIWRKLLKNNKLKWDTRELKQLSPKKSIKSLIHEDALHG